MPRYKDGYYYQHYWDYKREIKKRCVLNVFMWPHMFFFFFLWLTFRFGFPTGEFVVVRLFHFKISTYLRCYAAVFFFFIRNKEEQCRPFVKWAFLCKECWSEEEFIWHLHLYSLIWCILRLAVQPPRFFSFHLSLSDVFCILLLCHTALFTFTLPL